MRIGRPFEFPEAQRQQIDKARRVSWLSIGLICSATSSEPVRAYLSGIMRA